MGDQIVYYEARTPSGSSREVLVTVTVTMYNYGHYVLDALESVKAQTLEAIELVVVDDASSDDGQDLVCQWLTANRERFERCVLVRHDHNRGLAAARNTAFRYARTEFVFVLDADNILYPACLQRLLEGLQQCTASFAYGYLERFGATVGLQNVRPWNPSTFQHGNAIDAMVLLRRRVWEIVDGYSTDMPVMGWEDFDLWFKIARARGWGVQVPEIVAKYRVHQTSMLQTITNAQPHRLWEYLKAKYPDNFEQRERGGRV